LKKKILIVFGTRPEAIKLCPLILALKKFSEKFETLVCVSAQHREMLDQVLTIFDIKPDFDLDIMKPDQSLYDVTTNVLHKTGRIIADVQPEMVIVQGDTTTTFATALAAYYNHVKVGHVEAGLRTCNKYSPFPEEMNRKMTGAIADFHFAPTETAAQNLRNESVPVETIFVTGNTVIDALFWVKDKIVQQNKVFAELKAIDFSKRIILVTGHRRENFGQDFVDICLSLKKIAEKNCDVEIVYPVHLNPNVRKPVFDILHQIPNIKLLEPLEYEPFVYLMSKSFFIISDSGGVQEEAPSLKKPVLVTRETTERPEVLNMGAISLVKSDKELIVNAAQRLLDEQGYYKSFLVDSNPYGNGDACEKIARILEQRL